MSADTSGASLAIVGAGAVGLAVVARTGAYYLDVDRVAFALSLLIGAGLIAGLAELLGRVARVTRTRAEIAALPRPATLEAIEATSPPLRSVLRARLSGVRAAVPTVGFAATLVGLLVMVGLLGTFLGLIDALRGARAALAASDDVEGLRTALATPMLGLGRAFGISAAGLSASAMLGLASVVARRTEVALATAVHAYADNEMAPLTIAERQLASSERQAATAERHIAVAERQVAAIEALTRQTADAAAAAVRGTEATLAASVRASEATVAAAAAVHADVAAGVAGVGASVEAALTPALERAVARASDVTRERLGEWTTAVERDAETRAGRDAARSTEALASEARSATRLERHAEALEAALREHAARLATSTADALAGAAKGAEGASAAAERVVLAARDEVAAREASERAHAERTEVVLATLATATEQIATRAQGVLDAQVERQTELEGRWLAAHEASAARLVELLAQHARGLEEGLSSTRAIVDEAAGVLRASGVEMGAVAEVFTAAVDRYRDASAASLAALGGLDEAVDRAGKKAAVELLTDYLDQTREVFEHSLEVQRELFTELRALRTRGPAPTSEAPRVRA